jgi:hypothetical protein
MTMQVDMSELYQPSLEITKQKGEPRKITKFKGKNLMQNDETEKKIIKKTEKKKFELTWVNLIDPPLAT